jgi:PKD repeat protein
MEYDGWHVDDIQITAGGPGCSLAVAPVADFMSSSPVLLGQPMLFTNQSTGTQPITFAWDFGDGVGTSTEENPSYTYTATGTYTVTLTATNEVDVSTISHPVLVQPVILKFFLPFTLK